MKQRRKVKVTKTRDARAHKMNSNHRVLSIPAVPLRGWQS